MNAPDDELRGMTALVLGGTGLIGSHIVASLLRRGCAVRVMSRAARIGAGGETAPGPAAWPPALRGMEVDLVGGDLSDPDSLRRAIAGCDLLFHAAAPYPSRHFGMEPLVRRAEKDIESLLAICREATPPELLRFDARYAEKVAIEQAEMAARVARVQPERLDDVRQGVRDAALLPLAQRGMLNASLHRPLAEVCGAPGLKRTVYTSSVTTIGRPRGAEPGLESARAAREIDRYGFGRDPSPYFLAKRLLEAAVTRAANEGLPAVITNPTLVIGPGDAHLTTGRLFVPMMKRRMPFYLPGRVNAIAARDVGEGHVEAAIRGRTAQRYILGNETLEVRELLRMIAEEAGVPPPRLPIPFAIAEPLSLATEVIARIVNARWALFPTHSLRMIRATPPVDSALAVNELGLPQTPVREAIRSAIDWYRREGLA